MCNAAILITKSYYERAVTANTLGFSGALSAEHHVPDTPVLAETILLRLLCGGSGWTHMVCTRCFSLMSVPRQLPQAMHLIRWDLN